MHASRDDFDAITRGLRTKSDKIRALAREGVATADIARYLGIRYQHARNVLVGSGLHTRRDGKSAARGTTAEPAASRDPAAWVMIDTLGRLQIPADVMKAARVAGDEPVCVRANEDGIEILSRRAALKRAHEIARQFVPEGASLADDLIAERRREAVLENG
jgi:bifunctional DNA-binding transcriptional regulator/antitoxin component of YhaV-PrlF toxin-antitoxin module